MDAVNIKKSTNAEDIILSVARQFPIVTKSRLISWSAHRLARNNGEIDDGRYHLSCAIKNQKIITQTLDKLLIAGIILRQHRRPYHHYYYYIGV